MSDVTLPHTFQLEPGGNLGAYCGPASTRVVLSCQGLTPSQDDIAALEGTNVSGETDSVANVLTAINHYLPTAEYVTVLIPGSDATVAQASQISASLVSSINAGFGIVCNVVGPIQTNDGSSYSYPSGHYVGVVGYTDNGANFLVEDVAVREYYVTAAAMATWIAGRGYCYSTSSTESVSTNQTLVNVDMIQPSGYYVELPHF